jgi:hypothetical protein
VVLGFLVFGIAAVAQQPPFDKPTSTSVRAESSELPDPVVLHDGTEVVLRNIDPIASNVSHTNEAIQFEVIRDVTSDGEILILEHAIAVGHVIAAEHAKLVHHGGKLTIAIDGVQLASGDFARLRAVQARQERNFGWQDVGAATLIAATIYYMPLAPVYLMAKGEDVKIAPGTRFIAYMDGDVSLDRSRLQEQSPAGPVQSTATIYVFRGNQDALPDASLFVSCGRTLLGGLSDSSYLQFALPPGRYWIYTEGPTEKKSAEKRQGQVVVLQAEAGNSYYLEVANVPGKWRSVRSTMRQVDAGTGSEEVFKADYRTYVVPSDHERAALSKPPKGVKPN